MRAEGCVQGETSDSTREVGRSVRASSRSPARSQGGPRAVASSGGCFQLGSGKQSPGTAGVRLRCSSRFRGSVAAPAVPASVNSAEVGSCCPAESGRGPALRAGPAAPTAEPSQRDGTGDSPHSACFYREGAPGTQIRAPLRVKHWARSQRGKDEWKILGGKPRVMFGNSGSGPAGQTGSGRRNARTRVPMTS